MLHQNHDLRVIEDEKRELGLYAKQSHPPLQQLCRTPEAVPVSDNTVLLLLSAEPIPNSALAATCHTPMTPRSRGAITEHSEQRFQRKARHSALQWRRKVSECTRRREEGREGTAALEIAVISSPKLDATFAIRLGGVCG